ncbi:adenosylmethionine-8-amino-7-oxononanoate aminotransferase [Lachnotalea glycerini]|uniref:Adenosylmethionine-8-amino-7-oxononanoate aminotransferase n=1 Tax=Lachnotalea glycerini TaxID=1763509 RepID=A0A255I1W3_9FIRM|nr:aminotransferase class III-fold pyridoxal phosphate-dependent enzyme [Lachnotalea glycerini]PXV93720.1 adenosylmethionine-8-amino-7-oxononanoate aminotransferase [Lachnotalea glycerini]RDY32662.1 aspartate aminotransferase family protein [Lachnotalea glycerini]
MNTINLRTMMEQNEEINYPIWHPFSTVAKNYFNQLMIERGNGIYVYDNNNKRYIDACSGLWNVSLGYGNSKIKDYINKQLDKISYCSLFEHTNSTAILAANKILDLLPDSMNKIQFTCSGSESVDLAIKTMREYWKIRGKETKDKIICIKKSYHGTYYGSMSVSGITQEETRRYGPLLPNIVDLDIPNAKMVEQEFTECAEQLEHYIRENHESIAGIIIEPVLVSAGFEIIPINYMNRLYKICEDNQVLFTMDEVALGFYRTGKAFYFNYTDFVPDILCMAKGINSGYLPLGAVTIHDKIVQVYKKSGACLAHGSTQAGNVLACAAAVAALEEYKELNIENNVLQEGIYFKSELASKLNRCNNVKEIRGIGLLLSIDLVHENKIDCLDEKKICYIQSMLSKEGLLVYRSMAGLILLPMLNIKREESNNIITILKSFFSNYLF